MSNSDSDIDLDFGYAPDAVAPPCRVLFASSATFPSSRRLSSSHHTLPGRPIKKSAYVSLLGRLVNSEEATSWRTVGGLKGDAAVAWELMTPIQRVVLVAVIGAAVAKSKKDDIIRRLRDSVQLRDRVLSDMQQKLDDLCKQLNGVKEQERSGCDVEVVPGKDKRFPFDLSLESKGISFVDCGCWLCDHHHDQFNGFAGDIGRRASNGSEMLFAKMGFNEEPEERRMSDLSDLASSVTSIMDSSEIQMSAFAMEQDAYNLRKECEQKDATIRELTGILQLCDATASKRIIELEDLVRRKNMIVTKLKKDMVILEQKVVHLTRLQRLSSSRVGTKPANPPCMTVNVLYDMDSTTSPSSSDSDHSPGSKSQVLVTKEKEILTENPTDDKVIKVSTKQKRGGESTPSGDPRRGRRPSSSKQVGFKH
ncbi:hypothetical protein MLD38_003399 [Melastoma candidum]|uniref:Uncharacterized protein n=1 Tax=Melastoma candidum TaxID=119954 RepID=A0ACB9S250_9MYRT|nr:hypothetical protein MLD38_003399 [Melastoma candidum]